MTMDIEFPDILNRWRDVCLLDLYYNRGMITIVVQAGGESRRMGRDKGLVPFLGKPLIQRVLQRTSALAQEVLVTTNKPEDYEFTGYPLFPDFYPGRGALGGLYTALRAASQPLVAVVACDMPFVSPRLLQAELEKLQQSLSAGEQALDAVIPRGEGGTEPFHAVYHRSACLPLIETVMQQNRWRVDSWFASANLYLMDLAEMQHYDPHGLAFWNVNTPEELIQAEELALRLDAQQE